MFYPKVPEQSHTRLPTEVEPSQPPTGEKSLGRVIKGARA